MLIYRGYTFIRINGYWRLMPYADIAFGKSVDEIIKFVDEFEDRWSKEN